MAIATAEKPSGAVTVLITRRVSGLGHWFAAPVGPKQNPPPRWKVAVVT
jgi:antibiotic biosynthesis monooxygenase (ABM) superfamily enzyme